MTRISRISRRAVLLTFLSLTLSGCLWYFYPAEPAADLLIHESFDGLDTSYMWEAGVRSGGEPAFLVTGGRIEIHGPGHYIRTRERYPVDSTMRLDWSVVNGDVTAQPFPAANAETADFSIYFDELDIGVDLLLYRDTGEAIVDVIRIVDTFGQDIVDPPPAVESTGVTRGLIRIDIANLGDKYEISASVPECGLEAAAVVTAFDHPDSRLTVDVNGLENDPRCLEELFLYRAPSLGELP